MTRATTTRSRGAFVLSRSGKSQSAIAKKIGVTQGLVAYWLNGQRKPGPDKREALRDGFGIAPAWWDELVTDGVVGTFTTTATLAQAPASPAPALFARLAEQKEAAPAPPAAAPVEPARAPRPVIVGATPAETLERLLVQQLNDCQTDPDMTPLEVAKVSSELTRALERLRKMKGEDAPETQVLKHPKWIAVKEAILDELRAVIREGLSGVDVTRRIADRLEALG